MKLHEIYAAAQLAGDSIKTEIRRLPLGNAVLLSESEFEALETYTPDTLYFIYADTPTASAMSPAMIAGQLTLDDMEISEDELAVEDPEDELSDE